VGAHEPAGRVARRLWLAIGRSKAEILPRLLVISVQTVVIAARVIGADGLRIYRGRVAALSVGPSDGEWSLFVLVWLRATLGLHSEELGAPNKESRSERERERERYLVGPLN